MNEYLSDSEKASVVAFVSNKAMFDAVKKVVLHAIYRQGTLGQGEAPVAENWVFGISMPGASNEQLGEELKASLKGLGYLQDGFKKLAEVSVPETKKSKGNPAL